MNSKGHLVISIIKSMLRIVGCFIAIDSKNFSLGFSMFMIAEGLGVAEELVDKR